MWLIGALGCAVGAEPEAGQPPFQQFPPGAAAEDDAGSDDDGGDGDEQGDDGFDGGSSADDAEPIPDPSDGGDALGDCCDGQDTPGCNDPEVASCVCALQPECCEDYWADGCVVRGVMLGCMECSGLDDGGDDGGAPSDDGGAGDDGGGGGAGPTNGCCTPSMGPGCTDAAVESCVCMADAFCCDSAWDEVCVDLVDSESCGDCGGGGAPDPTGGGDGGGGAPATGCCMPSATPGCGNLIVEVCVCAQDPICCLFGWDEVCVQEVTELMCGTC